MIANQPNSETEQELHFERFPALELLFQTIRDRYPEFDLRNCEGGAEIHFMNQVHGNLNRACLRIFFPSDSKCVLFFYKKSAVPFSRDRFSYGGVVIDERSSSRFTKSDAAEWVDFLLSGLQPGQRPASLKKSIPYTIPEN